MRAVAVSITVGCIVLGACAERERRACQLDYEGCGAGASCPDPTVCTELGWTYGNGHLCTLECDDERDCPSNGVRPARCLDVASTGRFLCFPSCAGDYECDDGQVCQPLERGGRVCLP